MVDDGRISNHYQMMIVDEYAGLETQAVFPEGDDTTRIDVPMVRAQADRSEAAYVDRVKEGA